MREGTSQPSPKSPYNQSVKWVALCNHFFGPLGAILHGRTPCLPRETERADMEKKKLLAETAVKLVDATALMNLQYGIAFNSMITLNFRQAGLTEQSEISATLTSMNKAIARRFRAFDAKYNLSGAHPYCYLYVHEYVESKGHHVHQLVAMHEGIHARFDRFLDSWTERNLPAGFDPRALHYRGLEFLRHKTRAENQEHLLRYVLKATEDACFPDRNNQPKSLRSILGLADRSRYFVADVDRPAGVSQNLAKQAQYRGNVACGFDYEPIEHQLSGDNLMYFKRRRTSEDFGRKLGMLDI